MQLEQVDKSLWCNLLEFAIAVPYNLVCLEHIIMIRRLIYLQYILKQEEYSLVKKFFKTQKVDLKKKDRDKTIEEGLRHLDIEITTIKRRG